MTWTCRRRRLDLQKPRCNCNLDPLQDVLQGQRRKPASLLLSWGVPTRSAQQIARPETVLKAQERETMCPTPGVTDQKEGSLIHKKFSRTATMTLGCFSARLGLHRINRDYPAYIEASLGLHRIDRNYYAFTKAWKHSKGQLPPLTRTTSVAVYTTDSTSSCTLMI